MRSHDLGQVTCSDGEGVTVLLIASELDSLTTQYILYSTLVVHLHTNILT